jgi:hypothetical protein
MMSKSEFNRLQAQTADKTIPDDINQLLNLLEEYSMHVVESKLEGDDAGTQVMIEARQRVRARLEVAIKVMMK